MRINKNLKLLTSFLMFLPILSWCQTEKENSKAEIRWNQYKNEIALDCKFLNKDLNLNSIGSNLIYKKRFGEKKFISVTDKKSWRFQIGGYANYPISSKDTFNVWGQPFTYIDNEKVINVRFLAGIEWQKQMGRIQLYYGLDTGISFYKNIDPLDLIYSSNNGIIFRYSGYEKLDLGVPIIGLIGVKYFFHPRFSVAIESSLSLGVFYTKYTTIIHDSGIPGNTRNENINSTNITFGTNYLRFINVAFHL
jgi:hypothetical protein